MLIGGIVAAVVVVALAAVLLIRRTGRNDVHSVEGYHRSIHTLETINAHPVAHGAAAETEPRGRPRGQIGVSRERVCGSGGQRQSG